MSAVDSQTSAPSKAPRHKGKNGTAVPTVCPPEPTKLTPAQLQQRGQAHLKHGLFVRVPNGLRLRARKVRCLVRKMYAVMPASLSRSSSERFLDIFRLRCSRSSSSRTSPDGACRVRF